ncbi:hypothetical protein [Paenibacillus melissococcoides]
MTTIDLEKKFAGALKSIARRPDVKTYSSRRRSSTSCCSEPQHSM